MNPTCKDCGKEMNCEDCRYWFRERVDGNKKEMIEGECRVNPPQILLVPVQSLSLGLAGNGPVLSINGFFPRTRSDIWCGKFMRLTVVGKSTLVDFTKNSGQDIGPGPWTTPGTPPDDGTP